jgi:hypothetical protein
MLEYESEPRQELDENVHPNLRESDQDQSNLLRFVPHGDFQIEWSQQSYFGVGSP